MLDTYIDLLNQGVETWNAWRGTHKDEIPDLNGISLKRKKLCRINFSGCNLRNADLTKSRLIDADLSGCDLSYAKFTRSIVRGSDFTGANLTNSDLGLADIRRSRFQEADLQLATLRGANLYKTRLVNAKVIRTDFLGANLYQTDFTGAVLSETVFADTNLSGTRGLVECRHSGPSIVDPRTLQSSGTLPTEFLRGCGLSDNYIEFLSQASVKSEQHYSCFISYASQDEPFAERLYQDLQNNGIRCWFAPEDVKIGDKILKAITENVRTQDKLLLILSKHSICSPWVEDEVTAAYRQERTRKQTVVIPIRLDESVFQSDEPWAEKLTSRKIGNFSAWQDPEAYNSTLKRLIRDLRIQMSS